MSESIYGDDFNTDPVDVEVEAVHPDSVGTGAAAEASCTEMVTTGGYPISVSFDGDGAAVAYLPNGEMERVEYVDGEIIVDGHVEEILIDAYGGYGVAYQPHAGPVTSDVSSAATTGEGSSGGGFHFFKRDRGNPGGGGGGWSGKQKRRRRGSGGGGGSGGGFHFSLIGAIFPNAALIKTGAIGSNNASGNAPSVISTGRPARKPRPRRK